MAKQDLRFGVRLPAEQRKRIDEFVNQGKFKTVSDVVRAALDQFFKQNA